MPAPLPTASTTTGLPFARDLARHGSRPALLHDGQALTYADLADRVHDVASALGRERRLVLVTASNDVDAVVTYLGALRGGHAVLLAPADDTRRQQLVAQYQPDVVHHGGQLLVESTAESAHVLHEELALLLGTSGSTGSSKLVRLSAANLTSNAEAIVAYLGIGPDDRAATTLPFHYCYGLSVLHSYLLAGASLALTDASVADAGFWSWARDAEITSFVGVPYTFDLLDRIGFEHVELPSLRYVTQAGGRLAPERVRHFAELGRRRGWQLVVMYGQTEATARMAYLPPELAAVAPGAIGVPIPGGSFEIEPRPGLPEGTGELVYRGPNVMLGYAEQPADLALGRVIDRLHTGDLGRLGEHGLYEVVGRASRLAKVFGVRVDLDDLERRLAEQGLEAAAASDDERIVLAVEPHAGRDAVAGEVAAMLGLPPTRVVVLAVDALPRHASGKLDYPAVLGAATGPRRPVRGPVLSAAEAPARTSATLPVNPVQHLYADVLGATVGPDDTFASLGGDSLSYVEASVGLEEVLGHLPEDWPNLTVAQLAARTVTRRGAPRVESATVLRAVGIVVIVAGHLKLLSVLGAAHVLLGVAGYNFARFQLAATGGSAARHVRAVARVAVPSMIWIGFAAALGFGYTAASVLLVNSTVEGATWDERWRYWFVDALVAILAVLAVLFVVPGTRRLERRRPFAFALACFVVALAPRFLLGPDLVHHIYRPVTVAWVFVLGWLIARATSQWTRALVTAFVVVSVWGFFGDTSREVVVIGGLLVLLWARDVPVPRVGQRLVVLLASTSLFIYLTHPQVYPAVRDATSPLVAFVASLVVGVLAGLAAQRGMTWVEQRGTLAVQRLRLGVRRSPAPA
jgi:acyl-CoA synthetase (AMP-forming)/AMP-acid ligase II